MEKPEPILGVAPRDIRDRERFIELAEAIIRHMTSTITSEHRIKPEWLSELSEICLRMEGHVDWKQFKTIWKKVFNDENQQK